MNEGEYLIAVGKKISKIRRSKGISMYQFIKLCPLPKNSLIEIEKGKRDFNMHTLFRIAEVLDVDAKELI